MFCWLSDCLVRCFPECLSLNIYVLGLIIRLFGEVSSRVFVCKYLGIGFQTGQALFVVISDSWHVEIKRFCLFVCANYSIAYILGQIWSRFLWNEYCNVIKIMLKMVLNTMQTFCYICSTDSLICVIQIFEIHKV